MDQTMTCLIRSNLLVSIKKQLKKAFEMHTNYIERKIPVEKIKVLQTDKIDNLISKIPWLVLGLISTVILIFWKPLRFK